MPSVFLCGILFRESESMPSVILAAFGFDKGELLQ